MEVDVPRESAPIIGPNPLPELTHVAVAMESSSYSENNFYTFAVLNSLMGGGGSFSAGGPGKGMYTQLYLNVLNKHHWIYHAQAINHAYSDTGTFCLFGSSHPSMSRKLVEVLCQQFYNMTQSPNPIAVARAKKQLQSTLLMNLESRLINFEDIGRQVLAHSKRLSAKQICDKIGTS
ncbi:PREDICTED: mitochondrial-processing peptidase subunit alpha-like, partial [Amphimedon queenslandica]|uniref:Peptidase M16 C-terminal domain-containing protein n=1 Tax=Amphimedon queenslandica TaxID=400682 RepID=A0AAN0IRQ8_AMPQE